MDLRLKIFSNTTEFNLDKETAVAIGKFDGVHMGHRALLREILEQKRQGFASCVFTFDPTPSVLFGLSDGKELSTREEKRSIFAGMGVDVLIEFPLTLETAAISPKRFVEKILVEGMKTKFIVAGTDVSFGSRGAGNAELLERMAPDCGFSVKTIDKISIDGIEVSSTYIRELIEKGCMEQAEKMLGEPYSLRGRVVHGNRIGRTLGFPTVNLLPEESKLLPPNGVYSSRIKVEDCIYDGITNIGYKPTVASERIMGVESYLYDFREEIYDKEITVYLKSFIRPEMQFANLEELRTQLQKDILEGRKEK